MRTKIYIFASLLSLAGCGAAHDDQVADAEQGFSSNQATQLDFEFDGSLTTDFAFNPKQQGQDQMVYTIGHLNHDNSVGRLDKLELTKVASSQEGGKTKISYHAKLPVAWGSKSNLPAQYRFSLPKDVSFSGL